MQYYSFFFIYENTFFKKVSCFDFDAKINIFPVTIYFSCKRRLSTALSQKLDVGLLYIPFPPNNLYAVQFPHLARKLMVME
jgi:hypothetical protein